MPQISAISINDGQSTPVAHVLQPIATQPLPLYKRNGVSVPAVGMESLKLSTQLSPTADGVNKVNIEFVIPVLEQTTGGTSSGYVAPPGVAHELRYKGTFYVHQRSDKVGRKDLRVLVANLLQHAAVASLIDDLEQPY